MDIDTFITTTWFAIALGVICQVFGTQKIKFWLPIYWSDFKRSRCIEVLSIILGFIPTFVYYCHLHHWDTNAMNTAFWLSILVVLSGTFLYRIGVAVLYNRYPHLEESLSAEGKAQKLKSDERCLV